VILARKLTTLLLSHSGAKARMIPELQHEGFHPNSAVIITVNTVQSELQPASLNKVKLKSNKNKM